MDPHTSRTYLVWTLLIIVGLYLLNVGSAEFIRFQPNKEYIYEFQSKTELKLVNNMTAKAKVSFK